MLNKIILSLVLTLVFLSCSQNSEKKVLRFAVVPELRSDLIIEKYRPLINYLEKELDRKVHIYVSTSYEEFIKAYLKGDFDLGYFGGVTFSIAHLKGSAMPLVIAKNDKEHTTYFISNKKNAKIGDFKNTRMSFVSMLSTSGHFMPRYFLSKNEITPESYFSEVHYSKSHDAVLRNLTRGDFELGTIKSSLYRKLIQAKDPDALKTHVVWKTPLYPDNLWAYNPKKIKKNEIELIKSTFLKLDKKEVLEHMNVSSFKEADLSLFQGLINQVKDSGIISKL